LDETFVAWNGMFLDEKWVGLKSMFWMKNRLVGLDIGCIGWNFGGAWLNWMFWMKILITGNGMILDENNGWAWILDVLFNEGH
jgi:hypothetical protein